MEKTLNQKVVSPEYLLLEAPRTRSFITGSEAASEAVRRANVDIAIAYPITPQSETMERVGTLYSEGYLKDYYRAEDEIGAFSAISGASRTGVRCLTASSGPGVMRGLEAIASWPGHRLPLVFLIMCRVINSPLSIQPDNIELGYMLNTGNILFHAENQQDFFDFTLAGFIISERCEVTLPVAIAVDGFFVTHARGWVSMPSADLKLPARDCYSEAVPMIDNENPPIRIARDAPIQKSNFISYQMHAAWQQEIFAAQERARRWISKYLGGLLEIINPNAETFIIASGSAVSQSREVLRYLAEKGQEIGLIKIKSLKPFPVNELRDACKNANKIIIPEFNCLGWLNREIRATLYGYTKAQITDGPRVYGGMTMPTELILDWVQNHQS